MCTHSEIVLKVLHEILNMHLDTFDRKRDLSMEHDLNLFLLCVYQHLKIGRNLKFRTTATYLLNCSQEQCSPLGYLLSST